MKLVVIDTETGGLNPVDYSILTLGACVWENGHITGSPFHMYIHEDVMATSPEALRINGITSEQMRSGKTPSFVVTAFEQWLRDQGVQGKPTLGGHNIAGFDMGFLKRLYRLAIKKMPFDYHVVDTMSLAFALRLIGKLNVPNVKLDTLSDYFGVRVREGGVAGAHRSDEDAIATAKVLTGLLRLIDSNVFPDEVAGNGLETQPVS